MSESFEKFKEFQNEVQNQLGKTIKFLRSDHGGEYLSNEFCEHLKQCGIVPQLTLPSICLNGMGSLSRGTELCWTWFSLRPAKLVSYCPFGDML